MASDVLILGCGYTGERVARALLAQKVAVTATSRNPEKLAELAEQGAKLYRLDLADPATLDGLGELVSPETTILHSLPVVGELEPTPLVLQALRQKPARLVYISTTSVYGEAQAVDETTPAIPVLPSPQLRVAAEQAVLSFGVSALCLRPAGIYGPGRGVHERMRKSSYRLVEDGSNVLSRIHVEDLAAHCLAALFKPEIVGTFPVADEDPAPARKVAEFCARLLNVPMPQGVRREDIHETLRVHRKVDGYAIRRLLGVTLKYPSYKVGIPAALAEINIM